MTTTAITPAEALGQAAKAYREDRFADAERLCHAMLATRPDAWEILQLLAVVQARLGRADEAVASYDRAIALRPEDAALFNNRGSILKELKRFDSALASYEKAVALKPDYADAHYNRGALLHKLQRHEEALASYERVLAAQPGHAGALNNRGAVLQRFGRFEEALASYEQMLSVHPGHAGVLNSRGVVLEKLERFEEALASYDQALAARPDHVEALCNRGNTLWMLNRFGEALASYEKALATKANYARALNGLARCALKVCHLAWRDRLSRDMPKLVSLRTWIIPPLFSLSYSEDQSLHLLCARKCIRQRVFVPAEPLWRGGTWRDSRIKVAYVRGRGPMAYHTAELFELHDRSRFELIGISYDGDETGQLNARLVAAFNRFFDVTAARDEEVARLLHDLRVDIAVDLQGHQRDARPGIFAYRPAPIQVSYLGFPGTTGADFIDYVIADPIVLPFDRQRYYTENIVHLPDCYRANDRKRTVAAHTPTRAEVGLPAQGFVFCFFDSAWKIAPAMFDVWMRLLQQVEGSVLWLLGDNEDAERNLRKEAAARGTDAERLVFADRINTADHLAHHALADLFLDTLPYNADTTASEALWAGLPVLTCQGEAFAGRVAASLLNAIGLDELVAHSLADYEALALRLAREPQLLGAYRGRLAEHRLTHPLFDTDRLRRHVEAAYVHMWELWQRGEKPKGFAVAAKGLSGIK